MTRQGRRSSRPVWWGLTVGLVAVAAAGWTASPAQAAWLTE